MLRVWNRKLLKQKARTIGLTMQWYGNGIPCEAPVVRLISKRNHLLVLPEDVRVIATELMTLFFTRRTWETAAPSCWVRHLHVPSRFATVRTKTQPMMNPVIIAVTRRNASV